MSTVTATRPHPETGELLQVVELAEAPFEMAIREELASETNRLVSRYGIPKDRAIKEAHDRVKAACAANVDDEKQTLLDGGFRQTRLS
jgi:hypothetical protein